MVHRHTPSLEPAIYPTNLVAALAEVLAEAGTAPAELLEGSGIAPDKLLAPETRVSYRQIRAVFTRAAQLGRDPQLALLAGLRMHVAAYGVVGYAVLSSSDHVTGAELAIRYARLVGPVCDLDREEDGDTAVWVYEPIFWHDRADPLYRLALELHFASHMTVLRNLYGPAFQLTELRAAYATPTHAPAYAAIFDCPVHFDQPRNEVRYALRHMEQPMAYANAVTHATISDMCEQHLAEVTRSGGLAAQIHRLLVEQPGRFPDVEAMAAELSMNARMLRRRLEVEGTSYRQILAEARRRLALAYLRKTDLTHEEIATRLGYSDAANFRHAFIRWTGRNPSEFRVR